MNNQKYEEKYWNKGMNFVAGVDEAGRGPLAGPVVAACVILKKYEIIEGINDSKKISPKKREKLYYEIINQAIAVGIGVVHEEKIDKMNILEATYLAMKKSIGMLSIKPEQVLIDGPRSNIKHYKTEHIINGDSLSLSIAAASIIAKVTRDRIMNEYDLIFPEFKFCNNKGYGTKVHIEALELHKATPVHRKSFKRVKEHLPNYNYIQKNNRFNLLGKQIISSNLVKKQFNRQYDRLHIKSANDYIDFAYTNSKEIKFYKIFTTYNKHLSNFKELLDIKIFIDFIENKIMKKESKKKFTFNVISIEFKQKNKPKILNLYSEKNY